MDLLISNGYLEPVKAPSGSEYTGATVTITKDATGSGNNTFQVKLAGTGFSIAGEDDASAKRSDVTLN